MGDMGIDRLEGVLPRVPELVATETENHAGRASFSKIIGEVLSDTNREINHAEKLARGVAEGKASAVETVLALNRADMSLKFVVQLRNKLVEAYREVRRLSR